MRCSRTDVESRIGKRFRQALSWTLRLVPSVPSRHHGLVDLLDGLFGVPCLINKGTFVAASQTVDFVPPPLPRE